MLMKGVNNYEWLKNMSYKGLSEGKVDFLKKQLYYKCKICKAKLCVGKVFSNKKDITEVKYYIVQCRGTF